MSEHTLPPHSLVKPGAALKAFRTEKGWSLADVSRLTGMPVSTLSKVENGKSQLTLDKLMRISIALKIDLPGLFTPPTGQYASNESSGRRSITRAGEGNAVDTSTGKHLYLAYDLLNKACVPIIIDVQARSLDEFGEFNRHPGEEMIFVIEGELDLYTTAYTPVNLKTGDTMYFDSNMGHAYIAVGEGRCRILSICLAPETELLNMIQNKATLVTTKEPTEI
jgi:transcriptional regulator with XRE-family HTH domain